MAREAEVILRAKDEASPVFDKAAVSLKGFGLVATQAAVQLAEKFAQVAKAGINAAMEGIRFGDAMSDLSKRVGVSTESLSVLSYAVERAGGDFATFEMGVKTLSSKLLDASQGGEEAQKTFNALGISVRDSGGKLKTFEAILPELADSFSKIDDTSTKTALAVDLFGRAGTNLIPLLSEGRKGIEDYTKRAEELGIVIGKDVAGQFDTIADLSKDVNSAILGLKIAFAEQLAPVLKPIIEDLIKFITNLRKSREFSDVVAASVSALREIFNALKGAFEAGLPIWKAIAEEIGNASRWWATLFDGIKKAREEQEKWNKALDAEAKIYPIVIGGKVQYFKATADGLKKITEEEAAKRSGLATDIEVTTARQEQTVALVEATFTTGEAEKLAWEEKIARIEEDKTLSEEQKLKKLTDLQEMGQADLSYGMLKDELTTAAITKTKDRIKAAEEEEKRVVAAQSLMALGYQTAQQISETALSAMLTGQKMFGPAMKNAMSEGVRSYLSTLLDQKLRELSVWAAAEVAKATASGFLTFGATLLMIPLIVAARTAGMAAIRGAIGFQRGGPVEGGIPGRDSVLARLTPGELVLPRPIADWFGEALGKGGKAGRFQEGGLVGEGAPVTINIENVSDARYIDILIENINDALLYRGQKLLASELV